MWIIYFLVILLVNNLAEAKQKQKKIKVVVPKILLDLPNCKIPELELINSAVSVKWTAIFNDTICKKEPDVSTLSADGKLSLTDYATSTFKDCCYTEILRPEALYSDGYELSKCKQFPATKSVSIPPETDYLFVTCTTRIASTSKQKQPPAKKFHSQLRLKSRLNPKLKYWTNFGVNNSKPVSVLLLMLDSTSRTHALRGIPETMKYMKEQMNFIDYKGYHALGEPTAENYVPMMLGTVTTDWERNKTNHYAGKFDNMPFIWKNFTDSHYVNMNNEDYPHYQTFNFYGRLGFTNQQYDYNLRPYYLAQFQLNKENSFKSAYLPTDKPGAYRRANNEFMCMEGKLMHEFMFAHTWKFLNVISPAETPSFSTSFLGWPQHDYLVGIRLLENTLLELMQNIRKIPAIYDNTIIALLGDHGFQRSRYSNTAEGLLERDLPLFQIRLPERFTKKYPDFAKNLKINAERLTSHLDFFKTLAHIHKIIQQEINGDVRDENQSYGYNRKYGISLFETIPITRTCAEAKIPPAFCSCDYPLYSPNYDINKYKKGN